MGDKSPIEWLAGADGARGASWNPIRARNLITGRIGWFCEHVTEACRFCYAETMNANMRNLPYGGTAVAYKLGHRNDVEIFLDEKVLRQPLSWHKPRKIFPCSMTDLYGRWVPDAWLDKIKAVEAMTPHHTYIELTKRPDRMRDYHTSAAMPARVAAAAFDLVRVPCVGHIEDEFPLRNVWAGPSCGDQADADKFIPLVLDTPLTKRIVSLEPLLGPVDLKNMDGPARQSGAHGWSSIWKDNAVGRAWLDWVIVGGESGPQARPFEIAWARSLVRECRSAGVRIFVKQVGSRPMSRGADDSGPLAPLLIGDRKGGDPSYWPADIRVREFPEAQQ